MRFDIIVSKILLIAKWKSVYMHFTVLTLTWQIKSIEHREVINKGIDIDCQNKNVLLK